MKWLLCQSNLAGETKTRASSCLSPYVKMRDLFSSLSSGRAESTERRLRDEIQVESIFLPYSRCLQLYGLARPAQRQEWGKKRKEKIIIKELKCPSSSIESGPDSPSPLNSCGDNRKINVKYSRIIKRRVT